MNFTLKRTVQCPKCPWKVSTNPYDIPDGYCATKHQNLANTIAQDTSIKSTLNVMACHESEPGNEDYCIGWLHNQLGLGNNITLRLTMLNCTNAHRIKVIGEQHEHFLDTLPKEPQCH